MLKPIKTEDQYDQALARIYDLMQTDIKENSNESDELEILIILVKEYENRTLPNAIPKSIGGH